VLYAIHSYPQWVPVEREKKPIPSGTEVKCDTELPGRHMCPGKKDMSTRTRSDIVSSCDFYIFLEKYGTFQLCVGNISPLVWKSSFFFFPVAAPTAQHHQRSQNTL
jgi:hypothetical protein